jgi:small subunit ribosomal protein S2
MSDNQNAQDLLIEEDTYLTSGVHIGTQQKSADMKDFIFKVRTDGLYVLDIKKTDERLRLAAKLIAGFRPEEVLVVSARQYGQKPVKKMGELTGIRILDSRFRPGSLTNPNSKGFFEPSLLVVTDPLADQQALHEAENIGIPVIGLCDTNNETKFLDVIIPTNNKGRRALALIYWLLTREILKQKEKIKKYDDFKPTVEEFEAEI